MMGAKSQPELIQRQRQGDDAETLGRQHSGQDDIAGREADAACTKPDGRT
jgi:hypothetical protein